MKEWEFLNMGHCSRSTTALFLFALLSSLGGGSEVFGQQNYLENSTFDSDVAGWAFIGEPGETLEWDGSLGHPAPGSLRLTAIDSSIRGPLAASDCFVAPPGNSWNLEAFGREEPGSISLGCGLVFFLYPQSDCSDPTNSVVSGQQTAGLDWTLLNATAEIPEGYNGIQAVLAMGVGLSASGACNFDSVRLTGPPNFAEVPTLSRHTLATLIAALALAGLFWLRRAH